MVTRYGNVMMSRGSVIPLFVEQIRSKHRITLTAPEMTRFMMSLDHSFELVDFALKNANQGDLFIQKAPACKIADLAQAIINLFDAPVAVDVIGTRHAEKVSEMLATADELARAEDMGDYFRIQSDKRDLNYELSHNRVPNKLGFQDFDSHTVKRLSVAEIEALLLTLPEIRKELA
jgi:UDP-glucose 4-epimerase